MHSFKKAFTFSYDDGTTQDIRLIEILNKYHLKATFHLMSDMLGTSGTVPLNNQEIPHVRVRPEDIPYIYAGHEIASHTLTHPFLPKLEEAEIIRQVEQDRLALSELAGYEVVGLAYPGGGVNYDSRVANILKKHTSIQYARTNTNTDCLAPQANLLQYKPTFCQYRQWDSLFEYAEKFLQEDSDSVKVFMLYGHAYEFDGHPERWEIFEEFCKLISGKPDIFYGTAKEILLSDCYQKAAKKQHNP